MIRAGDRRPALLLAAGAVFVLLVFRDFGVSWDEAVQARYGEAVLDYFASGFRDTRANELTDLRYYGPLFDTTAAAAYRPWPEARYEIRHLLNGLVALGAVAGAYAFGRRMGGVREGLLTAAFLALQPRFLGDAFANPKDMPFACAFIWAMVAALDLLTAPVPGPWVTLRCGLALGLVGAARPGGLPLAAAILALAALRSGGDAGRLAMRGAAILTTAWIVMIAPWPWAHASPLLNPLRAMREAASFSGTYEVLFAGERLPSDQLPRHYPLTFLAIAMPPATIALAAWGLIRSLPDRSSPRVVLALLWATLPPALFVALRPNVYDGIRHFLFVLPAIGWLAARGAIDLGRRHRLAWGLVAVALAAPIPALVRLHPYQSTYFNLAVGGLRGAQGRFETDYWATAYKEAAEWVNANRDRARGARGEVWIGANPYSVACATTYLDPEVRWRGYQAFGADGELPPGVDFYIGTTRYGLDRNFPESPVVFRVARAGATLAVVRGRRPIHAVTPM